MLENLALVGTCGSKIPYNFKKTPKITLKKASTFEQSGRTLLAEGGRRCWRVGCGVELWLSAELNEHRLDFLDPNELPGELGGVWNFQVFSKPFTSMITASEEGGS